MKIAIITVYNSSNFGSVLQARALYTLLKSEDHDVFFFDTGARSTWNGIIKPAVLSIAKSVLTLQIRKLKFQIKLIVSFMKNILSIKIKKKYFYLRQCDAIIFGSDEIWNVTRTEMQRFPVLFGGGIKCVKKISYAVSVNNATQKELSAFGLQEYLKDFTALSVRDTWSQKQVETLTNKKVERVVDPTFLFTINQNKNSYFRSRYKSYIALYYFNPDHEFIELMQHVSTISGKRLLSIGIWYDWCDVSVVAENPFIYYLKADCVITNTFHGTAFAINLERPFMCFVKGKKKIIELLNQFGLQECIADGLNAEKLVEAINRQNIDWQSVHKDLDEQRKKSLEYIHKSLGER
mgnify:CR=1 FL=1